MKRTERDRRDWSLLIFIVPLGILLMMIAGQIAMRIIPYWTLSVGMGSNLDIESGQQSLPRPLFSFQILTPFPWQNTYLTPNPENDWIFPPLIVIQPIATSTPTRIPESTETAIIPTATAEPTATIYIPPPPPITATRKPTDPPAATNPPTSPSMTPTQTATIPPTDVPTIPPTDVPTGIPSTPDPSWGAPIPSDIVIGNPDGTISQIPQGSYAVIDINASPIIVVGSSEINIYDLVYYEAEYEATGEIQLDNVILGISKYPDGQIYYEIFNWGNGSPDFNTNVSGYAEIDNQIISMNDLWNYPGTGILIDVDNAPSLPPPQPYEYLVIIAPINPSPDTMQVDSIEIFP